MNEVTNSAESTSSKRPGRPRKDGHDEKIIDATLRLIDSNRPVTVNAVVKESGVSRAAVYRRWSSLVDLVAEALDAGRAPVEIDTSGDIKETLIDVLFTNQARTTGVSYPHQRFRKRFELVMSDQDLQLAYWNSHVRRRREANIRALQVAQEKGQIRANLDIEACLDAILGVFYYQSVARGVNFTDQGTMQRCREAFEVIWRGMEP